MNHTRFLLFALGSLLWAASAQAQFEGKAKPINKLQMTSGQAAASANIAAPVISYGLTTASFTINGGTQTYTSTPTATISGGGGTGAIVTVIASGAGSNRLVTGINIVFPGSGYTSAPTITFSGTIKTAGTAPTGTGNASNFVVVSSTGGDSIASITLAYGGTGYVAAPTVTISAPASGTTATATATVSGGAVTAITVTNAGSGYSAASPPSVTISPSSTGVVPTGDPANAGMFASVGELAGVAGARNTDSTYANRYAATPDKSMVLAQASIGGVFASGLPRYNLGDVISVPLTKADLTTPAPAGYWRIKPVQPGEAFTGPGTPIPLGTINVLTATTTGTAVTVANVPTALVVGATLLGQPITKIVGTSVTLAGNANANISSSTASAITPTSTFYYSPHSEKVYASQSGRVSVIWVSVLPNGSGNYEVMTDTFAVSSTTTRSVRTIYWSEGIFDGPKVQVNDTRITTISPAYNSFVPKAVADEVSIPGYTPTTPNLTTLSFDRFTGVGLLHAYNVEGRILIEYLGNVRLAGNIYESLGTDIVNLVRVPPVSNPTVNLGQEITPHDGDANLTPSPVLSTTLNSSDYYGNVVRPNGTAAYFAERETGAPNNPENAEPLSTDAFNKVVLYWMELGDFNIKWPKFQDRYWLRWSPHLTDYAHYTVDATGSTADTGIAFANGALPQIIYQDDPAQAETQIDLTTQRLFVKFDPLTADKKNRSLLKFTSGSKVWYVNLYTQGEDRQTSLASSAVGTTANGILLNVPSTAAIEAGMVVSGPGINGVARVLRVISPTQLEIAGSLTLDTPTVVNGTASQSSTYPVDSAQYVADKALDGNTGTYTHTDESGPIAWWQMTWPTDRAVSKLTMVNRSGAEERLRDIEVSIMDANGNNVWISPVLNPGNILNGPASIVVDVAALKGAPVAGRSLRIRRIPQTANEVIVLSLAEVTVLSSPTVPTATLALNYTVQSDGDSVIDTTATVGTRITQPAGHENAGYISSGTGYYPAGYLNPFAVGVAAANLGAIIPVNALPTDNVFKIRWFKKVAAPTTDFQDLYVPGKWGRYTVSYPASTTPQIVIAQGVGTDDLVGPEAAGSVYVQNNVAQPGYNPNEEHAIMLGGRAYALREDLNITSGSSYTSQPFVLVAYTNNDDKRPAIHAYKVAREDATYKFNYISTAGTLLVKPYPLPLMPLPLVGSGVSRASKDLEIIFADAPTNDTVSASDAYKKFTFQDRKGFTWIHRGAHGVALSSTSNGTNSVTVNSTSKLAVGMNVTGPGVNGTATVTGITDATHLVLSQSLVTATSTLTYSAAQTLSMKLYYLSRAGFWVPGIGEPAAGTVLPFLRNAARSGQNLNINAIDNGQTDEPLTVVYNPVWPTNPPELRVGETLALPKFGLPQVRGQKSAQVYYEQSIAQADTATVLTKNSVTLHDPTREKVIALDHPSIGLTALPSSLKTTTSKGKTYFQNLPPHLQQRLYYDPLRGAKGSLVLVGAFHDEIAGEDYFDLNVLTTSTDPNVVTTTDQGLVKGLVSVNASDKTKWDNAIVLLTTRVETFKPDPAKFGSYIVDAAKNQDFDVGSIPRITDQNSAVDSYALTASGQGTGYVTMVFGNGNAFTPEGDPVQVQVFKIANQLYVGDLKVLTSSNPLDEQVTLRHSGDFAGRPQDYEFEWRWAPAVTVGGATAPEIYRTTMVKSIGDPLASTQNWYVVSDPGAVVATDAQFAAATTPVPFISRPTNVHPVNYVLDAQNQPTTTVITAGSYTDEDIASDYPALFLKSTVGVNLNSSVLPGSIVFSANLGSHDGFVLYVNGRAAMAYNAPSPRFTLTNASTGLSTNGLSKQFSVPPSYFSPGANDIRIAIYTTADANAFSTLGFQLEVAQEDDLVTSGSTWQIPGDPDHKNTNTALVGGNPLNPFGGPQFVLNDRWFTMRYKPKASANNVLGTPYSRWLPPQFVEGWVKRVLAAINPFEQRVKDLGNNQVSTDVSVITQAGTRWEGDVALTLDNINDVGLIAIYETVLNRAKSMSIDANTNDPDTNSALILAAGYLNDLYTLLGNEAYSDAANPTISLNDQSAVTEVNTSRFSFEGQVSSSLSEEMALLRGRDNLLSPGVASAPAYNRLYWNYTHGINSGEVIYAINYNIKEKVGSSTANGVIDEADAQRMFPQGHGDAYGHYLTALTGYYRLLTNANFTWTPRAEVVTVQGLPVTVDFQDERKFAASAGNIARTAQQILALAYRQSYQDNRAAGWEAYNETASPSSSNPNAGRNWGMDEWASRSTQGAFFNWVVGNAMVPDVDTYNTGVQKIDRTTVPELQQLATAGTNFQTTMDNANAHLNPLGLSPDAIAFDLSPSLMQSGVTHYQQVNQRALQGLLNAVGAFNQAATMTRSLRTQQDVLDDYNTTIVQQETAYVNQLVDIYGKPYSGDIGAGKLYAQGYSGPDLTHWFIVDRPNDLVSTSGTFNVVINEATALNTFTGQAVKDIVAGFVTPNLSAKTVTVQPSQWVQYNDVWKSGGLGSRPVTGALQDALQDAQQSWLALYQANVDYQTSVSSLKQQLKVFQDAVTYHQNVLSTVGSGNNQLTNLRQLMYSLNTAGDALDATSGYLKDYGDAAAEFLPRILGAVATDGTSTARGAAMEAADTASNITKVLALASKAAAAATDVNIATAEQSLALATQKLDFSQDEVQMAYELDNAYRQIATRAAGMMQLALAHQSALQKVNNVLDQGARILAEREVFRQRAAAIIQGYRTSDLGFRIFRDESLEQYRTLFDLASRYCYLAAKSYDYETGLLGTTQGQSVFAKIVASRSLGDLTGGVPQSTTSTLGDSGLAGMMAQLDADFSVAQGRLGLNNPDQYGTVFSLRSELYRIRTDQAIVADDDAWRQTLEQHMVTNLMNDADVATYCRNIKKPDGTPVPGIVIPFSTTIQHAKNFFGLDYLPGDHNYTPSNYATKIYNVGIALPGYIGMDSYATGTMSAGAPTSSDPNALGATPYVYFIPCGDDSMLAPPLGDTNILRTWTVHDQALPLPYNLGANAFNTTQFFNANGTLSEQPWVIRKHQAFRMVSDPSFFYSSVPAEFTNSRLIGRSVWNSRWKIVIPAYTLHSNEQTGLDRFSASVKDIQLFLRTYSHSGN